MTNIEFFAGKHALQECNELGYLCCLFDRDSDSNVEFESLLKKAYARLSQLIFVWRKNKLSPKLKRRLIQALVLSCPYTLMVAKHGISVVINWMSCEFWDERLTAGAQRQLHSSRCQCQWKTEESSQAEGTDSRYILPTSETVLHRTCVEMSWRFGPEDSRGRDRRLSGKRRHGWQRKMWSDDVKRSLDCDLSALADSLRIGNLFHNTVAKVTQGTRVLKTHWM